MSIDDIEKAQLDFRVLFGRTQMRLQEAGIFDTRPLKVVSSGQPNTVLKYFISIHHIIVNINGPGVILLEFKISLC